MSDQIPVDRADLEKLRVALVVASSAMDAAGFEPVRDAVPGGLRHAHWFVTQRLPGLDRLLAPEEQDDRYPVRCKNGHLVYREGRFIDCESCEKILPRSKVEHLSGIGFDPQHQFAEDGLCYCPQCKKSRKGDPAMAEDSND